MYLVSDMRFAAGLRPAHMCFYRNRIKSNKIFGSANNNNNKLVNLEIVQCQQIVISKLCAIECVRFGTGRRMLKIFNIFYFDEFV